MAKELAPVFGVRHFSPAAARHVLRFLDERDPDVVLIEGPSDATDQLVHLVHKKTEPPVAILAFTKTRPVRSLVYPLAAYCAEWVAARWALEKKRTVRFIDLPASIFLELRDDEAVDPEVEEATADAQPDRSRAYLDDPYELIAHVTGEHDHETWWERQFEHTHEVDAYRSAIFEFGKGLRDVRKDAPRRTEETLLREAYMRREIRDATAKGKKSAVVVCGAYHAPVLTDDLPATTDAELAKLKRADCVLTLMPYSYLRLSSQSGYGAGNHAPSYFETVFDEARAGTPDRVRARYLASVADALRKSGQTRSSADVIEALRLAEGLAALNGSAVPTLRDLRDAAITLLGHGDPRPVEAALRAVEIGTTVGRLPPGVSRTALQDDFHQLVKTLKLGAYIEDKDQKLELDLREDRTKKTKEAAFLDRARSTFLHRLAVLDVGFAKPLAREQRGTSREVWSVRWTPQCEITLAEKSLLADSVEAGAAYALALELEEAKDTGAATGTLLRAASCELADALSLATRKVQELTVDEAGFPSAAEAIANLSDVVRYGNVRDVDPAPLRPVLAQLYLRATLLLFGACVCADDAAKLVRRGIDRVHEVAFLGEDDVDPARWIEEVRRVAESDDRHAFLSGYATGLLIERGILDDDDIDREVARRLSPGTHADVGVGWFEGLVQRNRAALFMRKSLWASLSAYVDALDDDTFRRALLYLRRAFSTFSQGEIRRVVSVLGEVWKGAGAPELAALVERQLDEQEIADLQGDLADLDLL
ncbi:MAG: hypothetical protein KIT84_17640 [Labilithrix sp.]|nr:hypothetical protein [Labilithrix sp.]MCW5812856.1 hypothetical protein [Labilithrix sp.]